MVYVLNGEGGKWGYIFVKIHQTLHLLCVRFIRGKLYFTLKKKEYWQKEENTAALKLTIVRDLLKIISP